METWSHPKIFLRLSTNFYFISFIICHIALPYFLQFLRPPAHGRLKYGVLLVQWQVLVMRRKSTPMHPNYLTLRTVRKSIGTYFYSRIAEKVEKSEKKPPRIHEIDETSRKKEKRRAPCGPGHWSMDPSVPPERHRWIGNHANKQPSVGSVEASDTSLDSAPRRICSAVGNWWCFQNLEKKASCKVVNKTISN